MGRPGRLVGIVRGESGQPLGDIPVDVWVRASGTLPTEVPRAHRGRGRSTPTEVVFFDSDPPRTGPQGAFQTPSTLLGGSTYRVSIRQAGFEPFVSDWVTLDGERTAIPPIRLRALRTLRGFVGDRQGQGVAGARVFLPSRGPAATTDAQGRFVLAGVDTEKTFVLVNRPGFRFQGWPVDPAAQADELSLTLARRNEEPVQIIAPLPDPLPDGELKALARRLIEPYVARALAKGSDLDKLTALEALVEIDPGRVLELSNRGEIRTPRWAARLRLVIALEMAERDPAGAGDGRGNR